MSSIHKDPRGKSPYFYCALTLPNGRRTTRSTKQTDRRKAQAVADSWEKAAKMARDGILQDNAARKTISDLYEVTNGQPLPSSKVRAYFNSWLADKKVETASSTHRKYTDVITRFLSFLGHRGDEDLARISVQEITDFRNSEGCRVSISSANHALKVLRSALRNAYRLGFIHVNPADRVASLKLRKTEVERRAFTINELRKLLEVASSEWQGLILFGLYTGQRLSDIAALTWRNVDIIRREISLTTGKTRRRQVLPIADELFDFIEQMPAGENPTQPLFPKASEVISRNKRSAALSNQFYQLMVQAGLVEPRSHRSRGIGRSTQRKLNELSYHCLRHTTTSVLKNAGISSAISEEFVGHDSPAISRLYTHIDTEAMRRAINTVPRVLS